MPRGVRPPKPGRVQTLREARRAYHKAGGIPVLSPAQLRAAARTAEVEQRAADIKAKEKRANEQKRKKTQQQVREKEQRKRLVEQGKLPQESLWGKVRSSQPRLHTFLAPIRDREEHKRDASASAQTATNDVQEVEPEPPLHEELCDPHVSLSATQLSAGFVDDRALEVELNSTAGTRHSCGDIMPNTAEKSGGSLSASISRKRKAGDQLCALGPTKRVALHDFTPPVPVTLEISRKTESEFAASYASQTEGLHCLHVLSGFDDDLSESQISALFNVEGVGNDGQGEKVEPINQHNYESERVAMPSSRATTQLSTVRASMQALTDSIIVGTITVSKSNSPASSEADRMRSNDGCFETAAEDEFDADADEDLLTIASRILDATPPADQVMERAKGLETHYPCQQLRLSHTRDLTSARWRDRGFDPSDKQFSFDGVDDEDLAGLAGLFDCTPREAEMVK